MGPSHLERPVLFSLDLLFASALLGQSSDTAAPVDEVDTAETTNGEEVHVAQHMARLPDPSGPEPLSASFFAQPAYRISIGASFDFIEKFQASQVYGDLIIDLPEALRSKRAVSGFMGGIYQVRNITVDSFIPEEVYLVSVTPLPYAPAGDSAIVQLASATAVRRTVVDNLHFFASLYRPWHRTTEVAGSSGFYHLFNASIVRRRERITETYSATASDTIYVASATGPPTLPRDRQYEMVYSDLQLGFGQMLRHEFDDLALQFQGLVICMPFPFRVGYQAAFNAIGSRSGLIAGAEIRFDPHYGGQQYNVFLAKTFKLTEMARLVTSY